VRFTNLGCIALALLAACSSPLPPSSEPARRPPPSSSSPVPATSPSVRLSEPSPGARNWEQLRLHAAKRITAAHPNAVYHGKPPDILLAIPVLEIELNADGSVRRIDVLRHPRQAKDTTQMAIDAVHRAAPYGDVSRLPKPWKFTETFLFNDERKFKLRTLDG
jgi:hypothetical protein